MNRSNTQRQVVVVIYPNAHVLDVTGPVEVLTGSALFTGQDTPPYCVTLVAANRGPVLTTSGLTLNADMDFDSARAGLGAIDTLIVSGGHGALTALDDPELAAYVSYAAGKARRVVSICTGAMILAELGLLDNRKATTHWWWCSTLAERYPLIDVDEDAIYVRDGHVWTSAGVTSGMDLSLALIEEDLGYDIAIQVARYNVMYMMRPGGQSQFSAQLLAQQTNPGGAIGRILDYILDNPGSDLTVATLAARACMSARSFARKFRETTGITPAQYVETARLQTARVALEQSHSPVEQIAEQAGFGNAERMRRTFQRQLGISASDYRERFRRKIKVARHQHPAQRAGPASNR